MSYASFLNAAPSFTQLPVRLLRHAGMFFAMLVLMLAIGDQFPFSDFPMYAGLPESTICMRITDEHGKVVPLVRAFGLSTTVMKKQMVRETEQLKKAGNVPHAKRAPLEMQQRAGQHVLDWVLQHHVPRDPALIGQTVHLEQVRYTAKHGKVKTEVSVLAKGQVKGASKP